ncbi:phosphonoacetaldehyde hydrolase [Clostridium gasigenes]|uniref:phosphonoacetaldehyde hydrolase n=1 Tax=Clostridium gasigenes TaxID=94869 RepID=UPI0014382714|nr:phosphonoacetaldehyde hydrolase [Clostridium gasigenes]NKF08560.1 phosphonoacetaldehyde hydrolase [Clostridium gasigenes]QSW19570.1 phosphonoacetaldehyde hydrolase [Clostridium gasigenes]
MNNIEGVIFDWAGTTVDFGCFAPVNVFIEIFETAGIEVTMDEARGPMGMLKIDHIRTMLEMPRISLLWKEKYGKNYSEEDVEALYARFEPKLLEVLENYTEPIDGVIDVVEDLRAKGIKIGSTTGYTDKMIKIVSKGAKKRGYEPDCIVTPDSTNAKGRPHPHMINKNMQVLNLQEAYKIIKVGDTNSDIKEGLNAGVWSVGVVVGSSNMGLSKEGFDHISDNKKEKLITKIETGFMEVGADFTIRTIKELPKLIEKISELVGKGIMPNGK